MYCWRNGLIRRLPKLQQFGWTRDGEGTLCAQSRLCPWLPTSPLLSTETCQEPLRGEGTKPVLINPVYKCLCCLVLLYREYSTPPHVTQPCFPRQPTPMGLGSKPTLRTKEWRVLRGSAEGMLHSSKLLLPHRKAQFSHSLWNVIYKSGILMNSYSISRVTRFQ